MFDYDPVTGNLVHKYDVHGGKRAGSIAGSMQPAKYRQVMVNGVKYQVHHLVWVYHRGYSPTQLDHINRNKSDNRIENLRECTSTQNHGNASRQINNTSGYKGVTWHISNKKWMAQIKGKYLGMFKTAEGAAFAYDNAAIEIFGEFALTNQSLGYLRLK
jgi:hypothetical protein